MMKNNQLLDDMAKLAESAVGSAVEATRELERMVKGQVEKLLGRMNLVTREEFEAVREMAANARMEQEKLEKRVQELSAQLESLKINSII